MGTQNGYGIEALKELFAASPCGVALADAVSNEVIFANDAFVSMGGYSLEEYREQIGLDYRRLTIGTEADGVDRIEDKFASGGVVADGIYRVARKDGSVYWMRLNAHGIVADGRNCALCFVEDVTAQKENLEQMRLVAESIGSSISVMRVENGVERLAYANSTFFEMLGVEREKYEKDPVAYDVAFVSGEDRERAGEAIKRSVLTGRPQELEYRLLRPGRCAIWMNLRLSAMKETGGDGVVVASVATDITARKEAELALAIEKRRYQLVIDEMKAAILEWDMQTGEFYSSESYKEYAMSAVPSDVVLKNEGPVDNVHPDDMPALMQFFEELRKRTGRSETTLRLKLTAGGYRWCRMVALFFKDEDGRPLRTLGILIDINEEKEKSVILTSLMNNLPGGAVILKVTEDRLECQYFSEGITRLSGHTGEELRESVKQDRLFERSVYPPDLPMCLDKLHSLSAKQQQVSFTYRSQRNDGTFQWLTVSANVIREEDGCPVCYCVFTTPPDEAALYQSMAENGSIGIVVSDPENHEVYYTNRAFRSMLHIEDDRPRGRKCYEYVRGMASPCEGCAGKSLAPGETATAIHHFPKFGTYLKVRSSLIQWAGHTALLEYNVDVTDEYQERVRQRELINNVPAGIGFHELVNGKVRPGYLNDTFYSMVGESREERLRKMKGNVLRFTHPEDVHKLREAAQRLAGGSESESVLHRVRCGDGKYRWFQLDLSVAKREGKRVTVYTSYADCDEAIRARIAQDEATAVLQRQYREEQRQRELLEESSAAIFRLDFTGDKLIETVKTAEPFNDYESGMSLGGFFEKLKPRLPTEGDRRVAREFYDSAAMLALFEGGTTERTAKFYARQSDGRLHCLNHVCNMVKDENGDVNAYIFINDVTAETENTLAVQSVIDDETDLILLSNTVTETARLLRLNGERFFTERRTGTEFPHSMILEGEDIAAVLPEDAEAVHTFLELRGLEERLGKEQTATVTFLKRMPDGTVRRKRIQAGYLDGFREDIVLISRDITESYEEEQRVKRGLEAANRAKSEFLSRVSHDMRTPLNAVLGFTRLLQDEKELPEAAADYLKSIDDSSRYLLGLINDVLDMSKIEEGKLELHLEPYYYREFEETLGVLLAPKAREKGVEFAMSYNISAPETVYFDKLRLQQIFVNLIGNAIKFTPAGGKVTLGVSSDGPAADGKLPLTFVVSDNGIGMSEDFVKNRLFRPFEQERLGENQAETGTGLGLSIAKQLVVQMGGTISWESALGRGTTFTVKLCPRTGAKYGEIAKKEEAPHDCLAGAHILLCEDNLLNTVIAKRLLEKVGCITDTAENGRQGVERFRSSAPFEYDAVLMDIRMPVLDGLAAAAEIRALGREDARTVPIIAMSANAFDEDVRTSLGAGMNAHLAKPVEPQRLYDTLARQIMERSRSPKLSKKC